MNLLPSGKAVDVRHVLRNDAFLKWRAGGFCSATMCVRCSKGTIDPGRHCAREKVCRCHLHRRSREVNLPNRKQWSAMLKRTWAILKETVSSFMADDALGRGAAMAFYAVTALGPILLIVVAIAGFVFGEKAAQGALAEQFRSMMGAESAAMVQTVLRMQGKDRPASSPPSLASLRF
jgi:hypothetical protein